jgi:hypothetical protein
VSPPSEQRQEQTWNNHKSARPATPRIKRRTHYIKPIHDKPSYKAIQGNPEQPIHEYALHLLSMVCSQANPATAHYALDKPIDSMGDDESEQERLMRLQLRQRFVSAQSVGMTPIEFARRLLALWGGKLMQIPPAPPKKRRMTAEQNQPVQEHKKKQQNGAESRMERRSSLDDDNHDETPVKESHDGDAHRDTVPTPSSTSSFHTPDQNAALAFDFKPSPTPSPTPQEQQHFFQQLEKQQHSQSEFTMEPSNPETMGEDYGVYNTL